MIIIIIVQKQQRWLSTIRFDLIVANTVIERFEAADVDDGLGAEDESGA